MVEAILNLLDWTCHRAGKPYGLVKNRIWRGAKFPQSVRVIEGNERQKRRKAMVSARYKRLLQTDLHQERRTIQATRNAPGKKSARRGRFFPIGLTLGNRRIATASERESLYAMITEISGPATPAGSSERTATCSTNAASRSRPVVVEHRRRPQPRIARAAAMKDETVTLNRDHRRLRAGSISLSRRSR
jgi:hypothetical protein